VSDFFPGCSPTDLIPGDPNELRALSGRLSTLSQGLHGAGSSLQKIDAGSWQGDAAEAFKDVIKQQPGRYFAAGDAFGAASLSIQSFTNVLEASQAEASRAIGAYEDAQAATAAWEQRRAIAHAAGHPFTESDPGEEGRAEAERILVGARELVDGAAENTQSGLQNAESGAPKKPGFFHSLLHDVESPIQTYQRFRSDFVGALSRGEHLAVGGLERFVKGFADEQLAALRTIGIDPEAWTKELWKATPSWARHFVSGFGVGVAGMATGLVAIGNGVWDISPTRMLIDPLGWEKSVVGAGNDMVGVGRALEHPVKFAGLLVDSAEWHRDGWKAAGELLPAVIVAFATAGAGTEIDALSDAAKLERASGAVDSAEMFEGRADTLRDVVSATHDADHALDVKGVVDASKGKPSHTLDGGAVGEAIEFGE
jgi:Putative T7SS secretion signal domain